VSSPRYDIIIIGAGVVGCALARAAGALSDSVLVLERQSDVGDATSKANTAILHTGFDCTPGTLESRLVRRGYELLSAYAAAANIAVESTGGVLVAWNEEQAAALPGLQAKATANGYDETRLLTSDEVYQREPHLGAGVLGGLEVPGESIIDPWSPVLAFALEAHHRGVRFAFHELVERITREDDDHVVTTATATYRARWVLNAAGLSSGLVNEACGHHDFTVRPRRGELIVFDKLARPLVNTILLPVPTAKTKGVLVSPTVFGNVLLGPTADDIDDPTATATTEEGLARLLEAGRRIMPELLDEEVTATYAGLRAATEHSDYQLHVHEQDRYVCAGGIRSTGLTASLAIAEYVAEALRTHDDRFTPREVSTTPPVMPPLGETQVRPFQDGALIATTPAFGHILCHCERVSEEEIRAAARGPFGATSVGALRRRTRALNGRCQGFFCAAAVMATLADESGQTIEHLTGLDDE